MTGLRLCLRILRQLYALTCMTLMLRPVSCASCSRMWRVGLGVAAKAALRVSSCLALMVVRGPLRLVPEVCSSFSVLPSLPSSCTSCGSGDRLGSLQAVTAGGETHTPLSGTYITCSIRTEGLCCSSSSKLKEFFKWSLIFSRAAH
uniref:Uncharacterized protein n=1 Tax=Astyanax mexicanus TaxID=7994 RepID=A0A3B1J3H9_ASTMX